MFFTGRTQTQLSHMFVLLEGFHTIEDSKLQWWIVIAIFELPSVHTREREKTSLSLRFSIPERGEETWLVSVFLIWHAHWYFIWDRICIRKCTVYLQKWLEGHIAPPPPPPPNHNLEGKAFTRRFRCVIWEMRHWKTPLDHHLNCALQITLRDANLCTHEPKYRLSNDP